MKTEISFCPLCAGKLDEGEDEQFVCEDCESQFFIQVVDEGDIDDEEEDDPDKGFADAQVDTVIAVNAEQRRAAVLLRVKPNWRTTVPVQ